jgi:N,N'-diacetyllegionaminate synthase
MKKVIIIAEAGVNHNGDISLAKKLVDAAADAGADYVKFQTFKAEKLVSAKAKKADYQVQNTSTDESQLTMLKKLELSESDHHELISYCEKRKIKFLSTAFDMESSGLLESLKLDYFKIPSGEITNLPFLQMAGQSGLDIILSTGMATMEEVKEAMDVLLKNGAQKNKITILHCNTEYPTPMQDVNLFAMNSMAKEFNVAVGYSDHTEGIEVAIAAVALGADMIEKHLTLDKKMPGPDHKASLEPDELKAMIKAIRNIELALGDGVKKPSASEIKNISIARKSLHTAAALKKGKVLTREDLVIKRPGDGISAMQIEKAIGKKLLHDLSSDEKLNWTDLE